MDTALQIVALCGVGIVFVVLVVMAARDAAAARRQRLVSAFDQIVARMSEGSGDASRGEISGKLRGARVRLAYVSRGAGSSATSWTEVVVAIPHTDLLLALRPQNGGEAALVAQGLAVDVTVGDPAFDAAFVVEAAPAEQARAVLDAPTRARLLALNPLEITPVEGGWMLAKSGWVEEPDHAFELLDLAATLAERAAAARSAAGAPIELPPSSAASAMGYRDAGVVEQHLAREERNERERDELVAVREKRDEHQRASNRAALIAILVIVVGAMACAVTVAASHGGGSYSEDNGPSP